MDYFETPNNFCANQQLQNYLVTNKYVFHPCTAFKESRKLVAQCEVFTFTALPAYEVLSFEYSFVCAKLPVPVFYSLRDTIRNFKRGRSLNIS